MDLEKITQNWMPVEEGETRFGNAKRDHKRSWQRETETNAVHHVGTAAAIIFVLPTDVVYCRIVDFLIAIVLVSYTADIQ